MAVSSDQNQHTFLLSMSDIEAYESTPLKQRHPWESTYDLIRQSGQQFEDDTALAFLPTAAKNEVPIEVSFKELSQKIHQVANLLHNQGVRSDDAVAIVLPNLLETHFALWGSQAVGIASPINPMLEAEHIAKIMNVTKAKVLITLGAHGNAELTEKLDQIVEQVPTLESVLLISMDGILPRLTRTDIRLLNFSESLETQEKHYLSFKRQISGDDTAAYFHTGGTTGHPKVACLTHGSISFVAQLYSNHTSYLGRITLLSGLPLFHIFGAIVAGISCIYSGHKQVMMTAAGFRSPNVLPNWWHHVARFQARAFAAVPTLIATMLDIPVGDEDISCLQHVGSGAAPLSEKIKKAFEKKFDVIISNGYGMTESSCLLSGSYPEYPAPAGSVGRRLPYMEMQIAEVKDNKIVRVCKPGEVGEVLARGPHIFAGYLNPEDNEKAWVDHTWFNTGDRGIIDNEGYLTLTGRAKDLIIRGGHNIDPELIEEPLVKHPAVAMAVAVGQPDAHSGEIPVAYVTLVGGQSIEPEELVLYCQENISERAAIPKRIEIIDDMPLTAVAKIFKPALRNRATEFVVNSLLDEAGIKGTVLAELDMNRGQVAKISLEQPSEQSDVEQLLDRLPIFVDFMD